MHLKRMNPFKRIDWLGLYACLVVPFVLVVLSGLIPEWGQWYSISDWYRPQVEALAEGHLALGDTLSEIQHDNTWSGGGVQQVWGLGVPLLRLPFELLARACGYDAFPDRLTLAFWIFCVGFFAYRVLMRDSSANMQKDATPWSHGFTFRNLTGVLLLLFFPSLITLLSSRMMVFEEALTYTYLYGLVDVLTLIWLSYKPNLSRWLILCALAGLGAIIRPTLLFYGTASVVVGWWMLWRRKRMRDGKKWFALRSIGAHSHSWLWGLLLFLLGGGLLFLTNLLRFDDGFEFGHKLNVQLGDTMFGSMYSTRFGCPYESEPIASASKELFGMLFLPAKFNNGNWYEKVLFPGQSKTFRWREAYLRTFDLSVLALVLASWGMGVVTLLRRRKETKNPAEAEEAELTVPLTFWSLIASVPLVYFYLWTPVITSRYMLDFAPAFAVAIFALYQGGLHRIRKSKWANIGGVACLGWLIVEIVLSLIASERSPNWHTSVSHKTVASLHRHQKTKNNETTFDGLGWNKNSGSTGSVVTVFVHDVEFLELELEPNDSLIESMQKKGETKFPEANAEVIRAKIGLEYLEREAITQTDHGYRIRFRGPRKKVYQSGYQVAFIALIAKEDLGYMNSPWLLKSVRWNSTDKPKTILEPASESKTSKIAAPDKSE